MPADSLWEKVLLQLQQDVSSAFYKAFFAKTQLKDYNNGQAVISCASEPAKAQIAAKYASLVKTILDGLTSQNNTVTYIVESKENRPAKPAPLLEAIAHSQPVVSVFANHLSPRYTFDNFVVGTNNRLAVAVARAIADNPGSVYNPFFLYSSVGLGKTHLMQAIGNEAIKHSPNTKVLYLTGESFTNELVEAIQTSKKQYSAVTRLREKYRTVDMLLIDDIQFIAGRETTQEEFFHTFNALYLNRKQIIMTSDRPPKDIAKLEERLSSRFLSGMTADMQAPDLDIRIAILRQKRDALSLDINNEVIDFVAERVLSNVRELEGALLQVAARGQAQGLAVTQNDAAQVLGQVAAEQSKNYSTHTILKAVAAYYSVTLSDIKGPRRLQEMVRPRQIAMYLIRNLTGLPVVTIGDVFGGRDHSTVIHSTDKIALELKTDSKLNQDVINIKQSLTAEK